MAFSVNLENDILGAVFKGESLAVNSIYMGLFTTQPTEISSGVELPVTDGYIRVTMDPAVFSTQSGGEIIYEATLFFAATGPWSGPVEGMAIFDQHSAGTRVAQVAFSDPVDVDSGESIVIPPSGLVFTVQSC